MFRYSHLILLALVASIGCRTMKQVPVIPVEYADSGKAQAGAVAVPGAFSTINVGTSANDGTGDTLRAAFQKINTNFASITALSVPKFQTTNPGASAPFMAWDNDLEEIDFFNPEDYRATMKAATYVRTVAEMVALPVPSGNQSAVVIVGGRVTENDGGGGLFYYAATNSMSTNAGTIFQSTTGIGKYVAMNVNMFTPEMFGAVPNDITYAATNSVAFNLALQTMSQFYFPTTLLLRHNTYYFDATLLVTNNVGALTIEGYGRVGHLGGSGGTFSNSGSGLTFTGTNGYAMVVGHTNLTFNTVTLKGFRLAGVYGQTPHANGLLLQNCSEGFVEGVQINGAFENALTISGSTLMEFKDVLVSACTNALVFESTHAGLEFPEIAALRFYNFHAFEVGTVVLAKTTATSIDFVNPYFEHYTNAFRIQPNATEESISIADWHVKGGQMPNGSYYPQSRLLLVDLTGTNSYTIQRFSFEDGWSWTEDADYSVQINVGTNTPISRTIRKLEFKNWTGAGAQVAFLTNDFAFAQINFFGNTTATDGYLDDGSAVPLHVGVGYHQSAIQELGWLDASDSGPWGLPENAALTLAAGQFGYDTNANRPQWYSGTAQKPVASTDDITAAIGGTSGKLAKFSGDNSITNSTLISESGNQLNIGTQSSLHGMVNIAGGDLHVIDTGANDRAIVFWKNGQQMFAIGDYNNGFAIYMGTNTSPSLVINTNGNDVYFPTLTATKIIGLDGASKLATATLSGLDWNGGTLRTVGQFPITQKVAGYTATGTDYAISCDTTSAGFTVALPAASTVQGKVYVIKKTSSDGNTLTIDPNGSETIDGAATKTTTTQWQTFRVISDGSNWLEI